MTMDKIKCYCCGKLEFLGNMKLYSTGVYAHEVCVASDDALGYHDSSERMVELGYTFLDGEWTKLGGNDNE